MNAFFPCMSASASLPIKVKRCAPIVADGAIVVSSSASSVCALWYFVSIGLAGSIDLSAVTSCGLAIELAKDGIEPICESAGILLWPVIVAVNAPLTVIVDPEASSSCSGGVAAWKAEADWTGLNASDGDKEEVVPAVSRDNDVFVEGSSL